MKIYRSLHDSAGRRMTRLPIAWRIWCRAEMRGLSHGWPRSPLALPLLLLPLYLLLGCQSTPEEEKPHEVNTGLDAGSTNLSITSVDAWQNIAPLLNPNFSINGATAFSEAIPTTSDVSSDFVQALAAQLALSVRGGGGAALPAPSTSTPPAFSPAPPTAASLAAMPGPTTPIGQDPVL